MIMFDQPSLFNDVLDHMKQVYSFTPLQNVIECGTQHRLCYYFYILSIHTSHTQIHIYYLFKNHCFLTFFFHFVYNTLSDS